jgi:peptidoglycan/LPS O-acetylase OafA/YrhL
MILPTLRAFLRQRFTRVTTSVAFIPQLDGLRAVAIFLVITHHVFAIYLETTHRLGTGSLPRDWALIAPRSRLVNWALHTAIGVSMFFVISGFILAIPFARRYLKGIAPPSRKMYLLRRLIRMEPPYFLSMTFMFLLLLIGPHPSWTHFGQMAHAFGFHYLASIVYLHGAIYGEGSWINGVAWTLEIEVQFYLLLPVIAELFRIRRTALRRAILIVVVIVSSLLAQFILPNLHNVRLELSCVSQMQFFLAGVLLADVYLDPPRIMRFGPHMSDALALVSAAILVYVLHWRPAVTWTEPLLLIGLFFAVFHGRWMKRLFALPMLTIPGTMCYTIFLYHFLVARTLLPFTILLFPPTHALWLDAGVQILLILPVLFLMSAILFLATERPFMVLSHEVARRFHPNPVPREVGV